MSVHKSSIAPRRRSISWKTTHCVQRVTTIPNSNAPLRTPRQYPFLERGGSPFQYVLVPRPCWRGSLHVNWVISALICSTIHQHWRTLHTQTEFWVPTSRVRWSTTPRYSPTQLHFPLFKLHSFTVSHSLFVTSQLCRLAWVSKNSHRSSDHPV